MSTTTLTAPALPCPTVGCFVFDLAEAHQPLGEPPPPTRVVAIGVCGVVLSVWPWSGPSELVDVPPGGSVELPRCPGWSARCGAVEPDRWAECWLEYTLPARA